MNATVTATVGIKFCNGDQYQRGCAADNGKSARAIHTWDGSSITPGELHFCAFHSPFDSVKPAKLSTENRLQAIGNLTTWWTEENNSRRAQSKYALTRTEIMERIEMLSDLGRSEKWKNSIAKWSLMVGDRQNPIDWATLQGAVWAGFAA